MFEILTSVEFKIGEVFGFSDAIPKTLAGAIEAVKPKAAVAKKKATTKKADE